MIYKSDKRWGVQTILILLLLIVVLSPVRAKAQIPLPIQIVHDPIHTAVNAAEASRKTFKDIADAAAMTFAKILIDQIVKSTITWANTGFEDKPAYVTDFDGYFTNLADGVAGDFINGSDLGFLCSPFQSSVRVALTAQYYQPAETVYQCRISGIKGNIDDFYNNFNNGGWEAFFSMTQNPTSNPYGAYLAAEADLAGRIDKKVSTQQTKLDWSQGFKSKGDCIKRNGNFEGENHALEGTQLAGEDYNSAYNPGDCIEYGPDKTPGSVIKDQLDKVLSDSSISKLVSVQNVEQLIGAFGSGLLQRYVFGANGLFSKKYNDYYSTPNDGAVAEPPQKLPAPYVSPETPSTPTAPTGGEQVSCSANKNTVAIGENVTWNAQQILGLNPIYSWSGEELSGSGASASVRYSTIGSKSASVSVSITDSTSTSRTVTKSCSGSVIVTDPNAIGENQ